MNMVHRCEKGIYDDYYIVIGDTYVSRDDVFFHDDVEYMITGIDENYKTYLMNVQTKNVSEYDLDTFIKLMQSTIIYKKNMYIENVKKNIQQNAMCKCYQSYEGTHNNK